MTSVNKKIRLPKEGVYDLGAIERKKMPDSVIRIRMIFEWEKLLQ